MFPDYGLIQMLQSQLMNLLGTALWLVLIVLIGHKLIDKMTESGGEDLRPSMKRYLSLGAIIIFIISVCAFIMSAGSIALKEIPRTGFDRGSVIEDGKTTVKGD